MTLIQKVKIFTDAVFEYQKELGLLDWRIEVDPNDNDVRNRALTTFDSVGKIGDICYCTDWLKREESRVKIKECAYHECLELVFARIHDYLTPMYSEQFRQEEIHAIIRLFENLKFGRKK